MVLEYSKGGQEVDHITDVWVSFGFALELLLDVFLPEGVVCTLLCEG